jgi:BirA family biotin operon repressor/biotin-[acetyl-CoA-carboxylase] ligase
VGVPILPYKVKSREQTRIIGRTIHFFRELPSTNEMAKELAKKGAKEGTVLVAKIQTHGRGRLDREWISPNGGLWLSIILRPKASAKEASKLTLMMSVTVAEAINKQFDLNSEIKWPNDVLVNGKKVCGILTETSSRRDLLNFAVIGVGINANFRLRDLPPNLRDSATTIKDEVKREIDSESFLRCLLEETEHYYNAFTTGDFNTILTEWKKLSKFLGSSVEVTDFGESIEGLAMGIDENGALIIKLRDNTTRKFVTGDMIVRTVKKNLA